MSTHNYRASFAMIGLVLLAGISASPVLAGKPNVANNKPTPTVLNKNKKPPTKASNSNNHPTAITWTLDKSKAKFGQLTQAEQAQFDIFQNAIANQRMSPKDAAAKMGDADFKVLNKATGQYQIRLSQKNRATFIVDNANHKVTILQVGGHT
jgi:hypothetical protein